MNIGKALILIGFILPVVTIYLMSWIYKKNINIIYKLSLLIIISSFFIVWVILPRVKNTSLETGFQILFATWSLFLVSAVITYFIAWIFKEIAKKANITYNTNSLVKITFFTFFVLVCYFVLSRLLMPDSVEDLTGWCIFHLPFIAPLVVMSSALSSITYLSFPKNLEKQVIFIPISVALFWGIGIYLSFVSSKSEFRPRIVYEIDIVSDATDITLYLPLLIYKGKPVEEILKIFERGEFDLVNTKYGKMLSLYISKLPYNHYPYGKYINIRGEKELEYTGIYSADNRTATIDFGINPQFIDEDGEEVIYDDEKVIYYDSHTVRIVSSIQKLSTAIYADFKGQFLEVKISCYLTAPFKETQKVFLGPFHSKPGPLADTLIYDICYNERLCETIIPPSYYNLSKEKENKLRRWCKEFSQKKTISECGWHSTSMIEVERKIKEK